MLSCIWTFFIIPMENEQRFLLPKHLWFSKMTLSYVVSINRKNVPRWKRHFKSRWINFSVLNKHLCGNWTVQVCKITVFVLWMQSLPGKRCGFRTSKPPRFILKRLIENWLNETKVLLGEVFFSFPRFLKCKYLVFFKIVCPIHLLKYEFWESNSYQKGKNLSYI